MKEEVGCMREDWKREQMLVIQLGNDIEFKENQIQEALEEKTIFKAQIVQLKSETSNLKAKLRDITNNSAMEDRQFSPSKETMNDGSLSRQKLESLLLERQEELEERNEELDAMKQGLDNILN